MAEQYQVRKLTSAGILGTYTKKQIDELWDKGKLGGTDSVLYQGEWILLSDFESKINQVAEQEINKLAEEKAAKKAKDQEEREAQQIEKKEQERKDEQEHRREIEKLRVQSSSDATPAPPPFQPDANAPPPPPSKKKVSPGAASGGGGIFVVIILAVLWHQGYWDPSDLKALIGQSKYIQVVRDTRIESQNKSLHEVFSRHITGLEWKSKRASKRSEIIIYCEGNADFDKLGSGKVYLSWVVNKAEKEKGIYKIKVNNNTLEKNEQAALLLLLVLP